MIKSIFAVFAIFGITAVAFLWALSRWGGYGGN